MHLINERAVADAAYLENAERRGVSRHEKRAFFTHCATAARKAGNHFSCLHQGVPDSWDMTANQ